MVGTGQEAGVVVPTQLSRYAAGYGVPGWLATELNSIVVVPTIWQLVNPIRASRILSTCPKPIQGTNAI